MAFPTPVPLVRGFSIGPMELVGALQSVEAVASAGGSLPAMETLIVLLAPFEHRQVEILRHLSDVVFGGQHPMHMLVNGHPAVPLRVGLGAIELA